MHLNQWPLQLTHILGSSWAIILVLVCATCFLETDGLVTNKLRREQNANVSMTKEGKRSQSNQPMKLYFTGQNPAGVLGNETTEHPLDPLTSSEIRLAKFIISSLRGDTKWVYKWITLKEPEKAKLLHSFLQNSDVSVMGAGVFTRKVLALILDPGNYEYYEAVINLNKLTLESWKKVKHVSSIVTMDDAISAEDIAFVHPDVIKRVHDLGYNMSQIVCDTWDAGYVADNPNYAAARKLLQVYFYGVENAEDNFYAHPLDFVVYVDLHSNTVRGIESVPSQNGFSRDNTNKGENSVPKATANYHPERRENATTNLHSLKVSQPQGPSFKLFGNKITWHNFIFRVGYNGREGVVIHHVKHSQNNIVRPVLYRMSLSEILVTYGDPRPPYHRKKSLEMGEFKLGSNSAPLLRDALCLGNAHYLDMVIHNDAGDPLVLKDSICIEEEDAGVLWAHYDRTNDKTSIKRSQRLSVSFLAALGHSDYLISWRFYQDATIELSVKLTGLKNTNLMGVDVKAPPYGNLMSPQVYTQISQYFFSARIDADVDSERNSVAVQDIVSQEGDVGSPSNPYGNGIIRKDTLLRNVEQGRTNTSPGTGRTWKIINTNSAPNSVTRCSVSWKLVPKGNTNVPLLLKRNSPLRSDTTMSWTDYSVWVLPYKDDQIFASGLWMKGDGLWDWTNANFSANIVNTDVVLWHTFGITSVPSVEDWPVSSDFQGNTGFILKPDSFFERNPAL